MNRKQWFLLFLMMIVLIGCSLKEDHEILIDEVQIIAPSSVGGGWDLTARAMKDILTKKQIVDEEITVINIIGAGGELGWKSINQQSNNHVLAVNSSLLLINHLLGRSKITYQDFTPIAILAKEWEVLLVSKDSNIRSAKSLMENLKKSPETFKLGVSPSVGNDDQLSFILAGKHEGIQLELLDYYVYENSDQVVEALLKNQIDFATMSLSEAKKYYDSNQVQLLVVSSDKRVKEIPEVPTWKEEGIDLTFQHWRGIMGPADMTKEEIQFWDEAIGNMVKTKEWKQTLQKNMWEDFYKNSRETSKYLEKQGKMYEELLGVNGRGLLP